MSREATGENGAVLGNSEYWNREPIHLFRWTDAAVVGAKNPQALRGIRGGAGGAGGGITKRRLNPQKEHRSTRAGSGKPPVL